MNSAFFISKSLSNQNESNYFGFWLRFVIFEPLASEVPEGVKEPGRQTTYY